ncbi:glycosyltransferase family 4 protein [Rathayibacter sp. VKM Ac-2835]|uniref:glycosyltransferase family 4 protein n=1 Tax=Rathayibacter sp. VKM Ac-2835 TaxID=2739043 RepID=UPI0015660BFD|nr:glycosyltransferase family 4 protein [Rathayibacter sp. VKM Ac-2835]NRG39796.1 glycosyltransferase family 4 protein [Rathayibacter sp. VKM Ac-2835]
MESKRRWLVATTEYAGLTPFTGGIGRGFASLLPALVRAGVQVDLVVYHWDPPLEGFDLEGVRILEYVRLRRRPAVWPLIGRALHLRALVRRSRYDAVFLAEWEGLGALLPRRAPLLTNLATGFHIADWIAGASTRGRTLRTRLVIALQKRLEKRQMTRSRGLIPISRAVRDWYAARIPALPPSVVVRNCIDVPAVQRSAQTSSLPDGWPAGPGPVVLFLSRIERRKGVLTAMRAFDELAAARPDVSFVFAGSFCFLEPTEEELLALIAEERHDRFTFLGHVAGGEVYAAIRAATIVTCPSRWEGFGNAALEVKAVGTPLVVTTGSGFDDFCEDGVDALMVPRDDPAVLGGAIARLLEEPELRERLTENASRGIDAFTADAVAPDLLAAADRLLGREPMGGGENEGGEGRR